MITVAQDGTGDFLSIKEAIVSLKKINESISIYSATDFAGNEQNQMRQIWIKKGRYKEQITINEPYIELIGEDAENTILTYDLYATMPSEDIGKLGTFRTYTFLVDAHDVIVRNLTIENSAGRGSKVGQAIAAYVDGDRIMFEDCKLLGSQDTLFTGPLPPKEIEKNGFIGPKQHAPRLNGRQYYHRCFISGDVDFIFGSATAFFEDCELFSRNADAPVNGYVTAASTPEGQDYGYVFNQCRFTSDCPKSSVYLGRPWRNYAQTVIINSYIGEHIIEQGWHDWNKTEARTTVFYREYGNYGPGAALNKRDNWVRRLGDHYSDTLENQKPEQISFWSKQRVLGGNDGWLCVGR